MRLVAAAIALSPAVLRPARAEVCGYFCTNWCEKDVLFCHQLECNPHNPKDCPGSTCEHRCISQVGTVAEAQETEPVGTALLIAVGAAAGGCCIVAFCIWKLRRCCDGADFRRRGSAAAAAVAAAAPWPGAGLEEGRGKRPAAGAGPRPPRVAGGVPDDWEWRVTHEDQRTAERGGRSPGSPRSVANPLPGAAAGAQPGLRGRSPSGSMAAGSSDGSRSTAASSASGPRRKRSKHPRRRREGDGARTPDSQSPRSVHSDGSGGAAEALPPHRSRMRRGARGPGGIDWDSEEEDGGAWAAGACPERLQGRPRSPRSVGSRTPQEGGGGSGRASPGGSATPPLAVRFRDCDADGGASAAPSSAGPPRRAPGRRDAEPLVVAESLLAARPRAPAPPVAPPRPSEEQERMRPQDTSGLTPEGRRCLQQVLSALDERSASKGSAASGGRPR